MILPELVEAIYRFIPVFCWSLLFRPVAYYRPFRQTPWRQMRSAKRQSASDTIYIHIHSAICIRMYTHVHKLYQYVLVCILYTSMYIVYMYSLYALYIYIIK